MTPDIFQNISKIIERESKSTTYKFALLRGTVDIILDHSPFIQKGEERVAIPLGLLIEKWLLYYYALLSANESFPQINNSNSQLAFAPSFQPILEYYQVRGGISLFYNDLRNKAIPKEINADFYALCKQLKNTITTMPMKYLGTSVNENQYFSIYEYKGGRSLRKSEVLNSKWLIDNFGTFSIPTPYYEALNVMGSFMAGTDNLLFKWADFSVKTSKEPLKASLVLDSLLTEPITVRQITQSKAFFKEVLSKEKEIFCVWSGAKLKTYDLDHLIPFSIFKNNDLWNLLPASAKINNQKRDKIPSVKTLLINKECILHYWHLLHHSDYQALFEEQLEIALIGSEFLNDGFETAFNQLVETCGYLAEVRGYSVWDL